MVKKQIYWIRHAESYSNISNNYDNVIDPNLTQDGIKQCEQLKKKIKSNGFNKFNGVNNFDDKIDLIVVSPLTRALETCSNVFNEFIGRVKFVCLEDIRERIDKPCHKRKQKKTLKNKYEFIDFSNLVSDDDELYNKYNGLEKKSNIIKRCNKFVKWLKDREELNIVVITHGNFLYPMFNNVLDNIPNKTFFYNCELRIYDLV